MNEKMVAHTLHKKSRPHVATPRKQVILALVLLPQVASPMLAQTRTIKVMNSAVLAELRRVLHPHDATFLHPLAP